jgi:hypothetical protein
VIRPKSLRWEWHVACTGDGRDACRALVGVPQRKIPLGRPRRRWENNIRMDLQEIVLGVDWTDLAEDRNKWRDILYTVIEFRFP